MSSTQTYYGEFAVATAAGSGETATLFRITAPEEFFEAISHDDQESIDSGQSKPGKLFWQSRDFHDPPSGATAAMCGIRLSEMPEKARLYTRLIKVEIWDKFVYALDEGERRILATRRQALKSLIIMLLTR